MLEVGGDQMLTQWHFKFHDISSRNFAQVPDHSKVLAQLGSADET